MSELPDAETGVYFFRHAPTAYNLDGRAMGAIDPPIVLPVQNSTEPGAIPRAPGIVGYTSPMQRTRQSFDWFFPNIVPRVDTRLRERDLGKWGGMRWDEIRVRYPGAYLESGALDPRFTPPGGEPLDVLLARIRSFLFDLRRLEELPTIVITHNGCIRIVKVLLGVIDLDEVFTANESITRPYFVTWAMLRQAELRETVALCDES